MKLIKRQSREQIYAFAFRGISYAVQAAVIEYRPVLLLYHPSRRSTCVEDMTGEEISGPAGPKVLRLLSFVGAGCNLISDSHFLLLLSTFSL